MATALHNLPKLVKLSSLHKNGLHSHDPLCHADSSSEYPSTRPSLSAGSKVPMPDTLTITSFRHGSRRWVASSPLHLEVEHLAHSCRVAAPHLGVVACARKREDLPQAFAWSFALAWDETLRWLKDTRLVEELALDVQDQLWQKFTALTTAFTCSLCRPASLPRWDGHEARCQDQCRGGNLCRCPRPKRKRI